MFVINRYSGRHTPKEAYSYNIFVPWLLKRNKSYSLEYYSSQIGRVGIDSSPARPAMERRLKLNQKWYELELSSAAFCASDRFSLDYRTVRIWWIWTRGHQCCNSEPETETTQLQFRLPTVDELLPRLVDRLLTCVIILLRAPSVHKAWANTHTIYNA